MPTPLVTAALIVCDEARHLEACLESIQDFVDEIVVVDTGSRDETPAIAKAVGADVHHLPWNDDFAAARNAALDRSLGRWILYIDADERVVPGSAEGVRDMLGEPDLVGCRVWLRAASALLPYRELRLFRNHPAVRFEGLIHENIWPALRRFMRAERGRVRDIELTLHHVGYDGDQAHKHPRNLPLLLKKLEEDPDHAYSRWHLGATYNGLGDLDKARESWELGVAAARRRLGRNWADAQSFAGLVELDADRPEVVAPLLDEAMWRYPDHPNLLWLKAQILMREQRWQDALPLLEDLAAWRSRPRRSDGIVGADTRLFDFFPHSALATCQYKLGQYAQAARHHEVAASHAPDPLEHRIKRQLCLTLAARTAAAAGTAARAGMVQEPGSPSSSDRERGATPPGIGSAAILPRSRQAGMPARKT